MAVVLDPVAGAAAGRPAMLTGTGLLAALARLGPHFALELHPPDAAPADGWQPFDELLATLDVRVAGVRAALAAASGRAHPDEVELRVAVSMAQLGLTGRLVSPALGVAVLTGGLLDLAPARLRWRPGPANTVAWSVPADAVPADAVPAGAVPVGAVPVEGRAGIPDLAGALAETVLAGPVRMLVEAAGRYGVSSQVLWGNVASVVHAVPGLIGAGAPELAAPAEALVAGVLDRPPLRGRFQDGAGAGFRRRSCCLVYRLVPAEPGGTEPAGTGPRARSTGPRAGICGDCLLERTD